MCRGLLVIKAHLVLLYRHNANTRLISWSGRRVQAWAVRKIWAAEINGWRFPFLWTKKWGGLLQRGAFHLIVPVSGSREPDVNVCNVCMNVKQGVAGNRAAPRNSFLDKHMDGSWKTLRRKQTINTERFSNAAAAIKVCLVIVCPLGLIFCRHVNTFRSANNWQQLEGLNVWVSHQHIGGATTLDLNNKQTKILVGGDHQTLRFLPNSLLAYRVKQVFTKYRRSVHHSMGMNQIPAAEFVCLCHWTDSQLFFFKFGRQFTTD